MSSFRFSTDGIIYTKAEQKIIDYIYQNMSSLLILSIGQLSDRLGVSEATISRFAKHAGYKDFKELKSDIISQSDQESPAEKMAETLMNNDSSEIINLLRRQQIYIEKTIEQIDHSEVENAVDAITNAKQIYLYGKGASIGLAKLFEFRLNRFGMQVTMLPSGGSGIFEKLINVQREDLIIIFGFQNMSREAQVILKYQKEKEYRTMLFSSRLYDSSNKRADINLFVYRGEAKEYHSSAAPTAFVDALIVMIAAKMEGTAVDKLSALHQLKQKYVDDIPR